MVRPWFAVVASVVVACGAPVSLPAGRQASKPEGLQEESSAEPDPKAQEFLLRDSTTASLAHGVGPSKIQPTATEAAVKFFVINKEDTSPFEGIVIKLTSPTGATFYTRETDAKGYAEILVPIGGTYDLEYLSLGRKKVSARVEVEEKPNLTLKLTLRYQPLGSKKSPPRFVLKGVEFAIGKATLRPESRKRLDTVVEYLKHKKSARIEISGHTDNVGKPAVNKKLSKKRAEACRDYIVSQGIDAGRVETIGYGDEKPLASNDTPKGRQKNRRIEATEL
jgi:outer membrane protein OmpA-like peptidoglycan-associated protein